MNLESSTATFNQRASLNINVWVSISSRYKPSFLSFRGRQMSYQGNKQSICSPGQASFKIAREVVPRRRSFWEVLFCADMQGLLEAVSSRTGSAEGIRGVIGGGEVDGSSGGSLWGCKENLGIQQKFCFQNWSIQSWRQIPKGILTFDPLYRAGSM